MASGAGEWPRQFLIERNCKSIPPFDEPYHSRSRQCLPICVWIVRTQHIPQLCDADGLIADLDQARAYHRELGFPEPSGLAYTVCRCQGHFLD
jgi:hypothetical protein